MPKINFSAIDKVVHVTIFFFLVGIWQLYILQKDDGQLSWRKSFKILLWSLFYGIIIEVFQGLFTVSRSADVYDVLANLGGALIGIMFFQKIKYIFTV